MVYYNHPNGKKGERLFLPGMAKNVGTAVRVSDYRYTTSNTTFGKAPEQCYLLGNIKTNI